MTAAARRQQRIRDNGVATCQACGTADCHRARHDDGSSGSRVALPVVQHGTSGTVSLTVALETSMDFGNRTASPAIRACSGHRGAGDLPRVAFMSGSPPRRPTRRHHRGGSRGGSGGPAAALGVASRLSSNGKAPPRAGRRQEDRSGPQCLGGVHREGRWLPSEHPCSFGATGPLLRSCDNTAGPKRRRPLGRRL